MACGEGTYIRTLCEDIGAAMGLPRTWDPLCARHPVRSFWRKAGRLKRLRATPMETLRGPECAISFPAVTLDARGSVDFCAGRAVCAVSQSFFGHVFVHDAIGGLIGVGECARFSHCSA